MYLLAIDSGKHSGYAWFDRGRLGFAGTFDGDKITRPPGFPESDQRIDALRNVMVVVEKPRTRSGVHAVPPNDLIKLALRAGRIAGVCSAVGCLQPVRFVFPEEWKGQLSKEVCWARAEGRLQPEELPAWRALKSGDARDAVGIGLWALQRLH